MLVNLIHWDYCKSCMKFTCTLNTAGSNVYNLNMTLKDVESNIFSKSNNHSNGEKWKTNCISWHLLWGYLVMFSKQRKCTKHGKLPLNVSLPVFDSCVKHVKHILLCGSELWGTHPTAIVTLEKCQLQYLKQELWVKQSVHYSCHTQRVWHLSIAH